MASSDDKSVLKNRQDAERKLKGILNKYQKLNVKEDDIIKLLVSEGGKGKSRQTFKFKFKRILLGFLGVLCVVLYFINGNTDDDLCWVDMPSLVTKATRPPEECSMCLEVDEVKYVSNITPEEFEYSYAYNGVPIVVTDATTDWEAMKIFNFDFFKKVYTETDLGHAARDCQFFPYKTEFHNLYDALEMSEERANLTVGTKPWYIGWSNCHDSIAKILRLYYSRPYFLPLSAENNAVDWIFMGGPGDGAQMHVDNVVHPSWQAQLKGRKRWYLAPPPECFYVCKSMNVTIHPGEIIVIDTNRWYHKTEILPGDISITIGAEYD